MQMLPAILLFAVSANAARDFPGRLTLREQTFPSNFQYKITVIGGPLVGSQYKCHEDLGKCYCEMVPPNWTSCTNNAKFQVDQNGKCLFRPAKSANETCSTLSPIETVPEGSQSITPGQNNVFSTNDGYFGCDLNNNMCDCFFQKTREWNPIQLSDGGLYAVQNTTYVDSPINPFFQKVHHSTACRFEYNIEGGRVLPPKPDLPIVTTGLPSSQRNFWANDNGDYVDGTQFSCSLNQGYCDCQARFKGKDPKFCRNTLFYKPLTFSNGGTVCRLAYDQEECYVVEVPVTKTVAITSVQSTPTLPSTGAQTTAI